MITIYTDGSCLTNPGKGGWAAIINQDGKIKKITGSEIKTIEIKNSPLFLFISSEIVII